MQNVVGVWKRTLEQKLELAEKEEDVHKIAQRMKQVQYGYNTAGYDRYLKLVPKDRRGSWKEHPRTPDASIAQSKRAWDGRVNQWRRELHKWDPPEGINKVKDDGAAEDHLSGDDDQPNAQFPPVDAQPDNDAPGEADREANGGDEDDDDDVL
jgi:histone RNA hairpin-binding protein